MNRDNGSCEAMESVSSNESLGWFMENEMDIGMPMNSESSSQVQQQQQQQPVAKDAQHPTTAAVQRPNAAKKRNTNRSKSRGQGSDSPLSDDVPSRSRHSRKKHVKAELKLNGAERLQPHSTVSSMSAAAHEKAFIETMKNSGSRLSRSLSSSKSMTNKNSTSEQSDQLSNVLNTDESSGDESGTGRSEAAVAAEQKFKDKNREHARNTRSRKKQYIEALKQAFNELSAEREQLDRERNETQAKTAEQVCTVLLSGCRVTDWLTD
jgi:hypothetical protein